MTATAVTSATTDPTVRAALAAAPAQMLRAVRPDPIATDPTSWSER